MTNPLIEFTKRIIADIDNLDDLIDSYFEGVKDYTDTASDIFTPIKAVSTLYNFNKKRRFKNFLKGYSKCLEEYDFTSATDTYRLKKYLKNEKNFNFLNDTIETALNSKSVYCSLILGYYAGYTLRDQNKLSFKDIITVEVLRELNDFELSCFVRIYSTVAFGENEVNIGDYPTLQYLKFFSELTVNKMINLRALDRSTIVNYGEDSVRFRSNEIAENIYFLIKDIDIEDELLKYEL